MGGGKGGHPRFFVFFAEPDKCVAGGEGRPCGRGRGGRVAVEGQPPHGGRVAGGDVASGEGLPHGGGLFLQKKIK